MEYIQMESAERMCILSKEFSFYKENRYNRSYGFLCIIKDEILLD